MQWKFYNYFKNKVSFKVKKTLYILRKTSFVQINVQVSFTIKKSVIYTKQNIILYNKNILLQFELRSVSHK